MSRAATKAAYKDRPDLKERFDYQVAWMEDPSVVGSDSMPYAQLGIETINFWINNKIFDKVGYKFINEASALKDIKAFNAHQAKLMTKTKLGKGTIIRDGGEANAHLAAVAAPEPSPEAIDPGGIPEEPPPMPVPDLLPTPEKASEIPNIKVSDVLED